MIWSAVQCVCSYSSVRRIVLFEQLAVAGSANDFLCRYRPLEAGLYRIDIAYQKLLVDKTPFLVKVAPAIAPESPLARFVAFGPALGDARPEIAPPDGVCLPYDRVGGTRQNPCWFTVESNGSQAKVTVELYAPQPMDVKLTSFKRADQSVDFCFVPPIPGAVELLLRISCTL